MMVHSFEFGGRQTLWRQISCLIKPAESPHDTVYHLRPVIVTKRAGDLPDDVVQSRTQSPARHDGRVHALGIEMQRISRSRPNVSRRGRLLPRLSDDGAQDALRRSDDAVVFLIVGNFRGRTAVVEAGEVERAPTPRRIFHDVDRGRTRRFETRAEVFDVPDVHVAYGDVFEEAAAGERCLVGGRCRSFGFRRVGCRGSRSAMAVSGKGRCS
mmetsp:Transcript_24480/g.55907  ORF Transcript_24480/g.55907 Transcript_24480/m.55907 type:complete len:212 (-) Transcript_24480:151-786(-)